MHVGMYACMRSESESELGNQLSGRLRKANKQTCIFVCFCMYVCMRSESESRLCWYYFANLSTVSVCLPVQTHTQATLKTQAHTCQVMIENQHFHSIAVSQCSVTRKNTHTHCNDGSPAKTPSGRVDNWFSDKESRLYRGETKS
jgi:hypothetical protein